MRAEIRLATTTPRDSISQIDAPKELFLAAIATAKPQHCPTQSSFTRISKHAEVCKPAPTDVNDAVESFLHRRVSWAADLSKRLVVAALDVGQVWSLLQSPFELQNVALEFEQVGGDLLRHAK